MGSTDVMDWFFCEEAVCGLVFVPLCTSASDVICVHDKNQRHVLFVPGVDQQLPISRHHKKCVCVCACV